MVHEQKFKDLLSSTCQTSVEKIVLDLESEVMRGPGSIPTGGNILSLDFFSHSKASDANIGIAVYCQFRLICEKLDYEFERIERVHTKSQWYNQ